MKRETSISRRSLLVGTACAALGALTGCTEPEPTAAEPQPELILRYAENQPEDYPTTKAALAFAEMVAQRTDGRVKVVVYSGGELGGELSVIEQMQFGGIDFARVSLSQLAGLLENLSVLQLPYLYEDAKQMWREHRGWVPLHAGKCGPGGAFVVRCRCPQLLHPGKGRDTGRSAGQGHPGAGIGHDE